MYNFAPMNGKISPVLIHLLGCLLFLALPILFAPETSLLSTTLLNPPTQRDLLSYVLLIGVFYANYMWAIPRFYFKRRFALFLTINLCCFALTVYLPNLAIPQEGTSGGAPPAGSITRAGARVQQDAPGQPPAQGYGPGGPQDRGPGGPPPGNPPPGNAPPDDGGGARSPGGAGDSSDAQRIGGPSGTQRIGGPGDSGWPRRAGDTGRSQRIGGPSGPGGPGPSGGPAPPGGYKPTLSLEISHHLFLFLGCVFFALALRFSERWKQTEREKLQAELAYLKAQVNPHFLFNTLNGIYSLTLEKSDRAPAAVARLGAMMRYVLHEAGRDSVLLEKEIAYIRDYMALQEVRFDKSVHLELMVEGDAGDKRVAPLVLIPFIENAFKHGVNPEEESSIIVRILIGAQDLRLEVVNKKVTVRLDPTERSGLGIRNTRDRLQLHYPGAHTLDIHNNPLDFIVLLWLKL